MIAALVAACGGGGEASVSSVPSRATPAPPPAPADRCELPPRTYADLAACQGSSEQLELQIAESYQGKTTAKIAIASKDPQEILAAMGAFTAEWSLGADSFTLFAYGSASDAAAGSYNRGRLFWNNGGPITLDICTAYMDLGDGGPEICSEEQHFTVTNG
ncbi:MAG: hypothetical protein AB1627_01105 [Chloroflexota bacterium]